MEPQDLQEEKGNDDDVLSYSMRSWLQARAGTCDSTDNINGAHTNTNNKLLISIECLRLLFLFLICIFYSFLLFTYLHVTGKYSVQNVTKWQRQYAETYHISWIVENFTNYHCKIIINLIYVLIVLFDTLYNVIIHDYVNKYSLSSAELLQFMFGPLHFSDARRFLVCCGVLISIIPLSYSALTNYIIFHRDTYNFATLSWDVEWFMGLLAMAIFISTFVFIHTTVFQLRINQNDNCMHQQSKSMVFKNVNDYCYFTHVLGCTITCGIFDTRNTTINNAGWALIVGTYYWCWSDLYYIACDIFGATEENNSQAVRLFVFGIIAFVNVTIFILGLYFSFWTQVSYKNEYEVQPMSILIWLIVYAVVSIIISIYFTKYSDINHTHDNMQQSKFYDLFSAGLHLLCISPCRSNCNKLCCDCKWYTPERRATLSNTMHACGNRVDTVCCDWIFKVTNTQNCTMRKSMDTSFKAMLSFILIATSLVIFYQRFVGFYLLWIAFLFHCDVMTNQKTCQEIRKKMLESIRNSND